ncbi:MAG: GNAT family N-acetyltransferase [Gammaproteobacteria bacterium]|jgi:GNAT superfamily N-acetyltransferase
MEAVFCASVRALCAEAYGQEIIDAWIGPPRLERFVKGQQRGNEYYVLIRDGQVAGFGALKLEDQLLEALFIDPSLAGQGLGRALLEFMAGVAQDAGCPKLRVSSSLNAVGFYRANGFSETGRGDLVLDGGVALGSVFMERPLPP